MKHIIKGSTPAELRRWFDGQLIDGKRINCSYAKDLPGEVKQIIKQRLLEEQGYLCCYTGIRIDENSSHIEHFKPQALCNDHEDVDYNNLLAAYPKGECSFGARARKDKELFVSPLRGDCESRFKYDELGQIKASSDDDNEAKETIVRLNLDDRFERDGKVFAGPLTDMRKRAIQSALYRGKYPLSKKQLNYVIESYCQRGKDNRFRPFCFIIQHAAVRLLRQVERDRLKRLAKK